MADLPWFKVYAADTLSDERFQGWSVDERGAWFTLICMAWREGSIPADQTSLAKALHVDGSAMRLLWSAIGDRFVSHPDYPGRLTSPRLEEERDKAKALSKKKSEAGKNGAESRWAKYRHRPSTAIAEPWQTDATAMANDSDQGRAEQRESQSQTSQPGEDPWLAGFRTKLAARLGLTEMDIGKDRSKVLSVFKQHLALVGEEMLLNDCAAAARKSESGTPSSLAWFVGWITRLPGTEAQA